MSSFEECFVEGQAGREEWSARFGRVLGVDPTDGTWRARAACRGSAAAALFWPKRGDQRGGARWFPVCAACPVVAECLVAGAGETFGTWGGVSAGDRRRVRMAWAASTDRAGLLARETPVAWAASRRQRRQAA